MNLQKVESTIVHACEEWLNKNKRGIVVALDDYYYPPHAKVTFGRFGCGF